MNTFAIKPGSSATPDMLLSVHPKLLMLLGRMGMLLIGKGIHPPIVITSIYRQKEQDSGIHSDWRAVDVSIAGMPEDALLAVHAQINDEYPYDKARPTLQTMVIHTGVGYNGDVGRHIHLQCKAD